MEDILETPHGSPSLAMTATKEAERREEEGCSSIILLLTVDHQADNNSLSYEGGSIDYRFASTN